MLAGGGSAVIWAALGEPYGFAASYAGWIIGLPVLIIVSLLTEHSADEDLQLFHSKTMTIKFNEYRNENV
jgi:solute:Na+ symporter, SSS family